MPLFLHLLFDWIGLDSCLRCMGKAEPRLLFQTSRPAYLYMYMYIYTKTYTIIESVSKSAWAVLMVGGVT